LRRGLLGIGPGGTKQEREQGDGGDAEPTDPNQGRTLFDRHTGKVG